MMETTGTRVAGLGMSSSGAVSTRCEERCHGEYRGGLEHAPVLPANVVQNHAPNGF
jgi:hypothetical protein